MRQLSIFSILTNSSVLVNASSTHPGNGFAAPAFPLLDGFSDECVSLNSRLRLGHLDSRALFIAFFLVFKNPTIL